MGHGRRAIPLEEFGSDTGPELESPVRYDDGHLTSPAVEGLSSPQPLSPTEGYARRRRTIARQARIRGELEETEWERDNSSDYRAIFDEDGVTIVGWYRSANGYEQIRDREGNRVWSDEIGLEQPLFSPIDLIGLGIGTAAARGVIRLGSHFAARFVARATARGMAEAAGRSTARRVADALRRAIQRIAARRSSGAGGEALARLARRAQELVQRLQSEGRRIVVNIGGEFPVGRDLDTVGEIARHAINLNPLDGRVAPSAVERLVQGRAEDIASFFTRGQIDEIVSSRLQPGWIDWDDAISGIHTVLRPGGRLRIIFQGGSPDEMATIVRLLRQHEFSDVVRVGDTAITALR